MVRDSLREMMEVACGTHEGVHAVLLPNPFPYSLENTALHEIANSPTSLETSLAICPITPVDVELLISHAACTREELTCVYACEQSDRHFYFEAIVSE